ncbi:MAG: hypothetical protein U0234_20260 [Sandaracinus sp.]
MTTSMELVGHLEDRATGRGLVHLRWVEDEGVRRWPSATWEAGVLEVGAEWARALVQLHAGAIEVVQVTLGGASGAVALRREADGVRCVLGADGWSGEVDVQDLSLSVITLLRGALFAYDVRSLAPDALRREARAALDALERAERTARPVDLFVRRSERDRADRDLRARLEMAAVASRWRVQCYDGEESIALPVRGAFDELVVGGWLHIEWMDDRAWWMRLGDMRVWITVNAPDDVRVDVERGHHSAVNGETTTAPR